MPLVAWVVTAHRILYTACPLQTEQIREEKRPPAQQRLPPRRQSCCRSGYCHLNSTLGGPMIAKSDTPLDFMCLVYAWYTKIWVQSIGLSQLVKEFYPLTARYLAVESSFSCSRHVVFMTDGLTYSNEKALAFDGLVLHFLGPSLLGWQLTKAATCVKHLWPAGSWPGCWCRLAVFASM